MSDELTRAIAEALGPPYREVWDASVAPGGYVCAECGTPVESEPCGDHAPKESDDEELKMAIWNGLDCGSPCHAHRARSECETTLARVAAALAPLIEARVREARAEELESEADRMEAHARRQIALPSNGSKARQKARNKQRGHNAGAVLTAARELRKRAEEVRRG